MTNTDVYKLRIKIEKIINCSQLPPVIVEGVLCDLLSELRWYSISELTEQNAILQLQLDELQKQEEDSSEE